MAYNRKVDFGPGEDELQVLREKHARLQREYDALKSSRDPERAKRPTKPPALRKSSIFLVIAVIMIGARTMLYAVVEGWGSHAANIGLALTVMFGCGVGLMIVAWGLEEWNESGWLLVPTFVFLFVAGLMCLQALNPALVETGQIDGPIQHPAIVATAFMLCLLFAATRLTLFVVVWLLALVTDPRRLFKHD